MAIKPNDCTVKIESLIVGFTPTTDMWGPTPVYQKFWNNFEQHVTELQRKEKNPDWTAILSRELIRYGAVYKETKNYSNRYVKFKTHSHLTAFILKWS